LDDVKTMNGPLAFRLWYHMVENFARRKLTYSEDKMPAFSGMARHFAGIFWQNMQRTNPKSTLTLPQRLPPDSQTPRYICGLWQEDLLHGLNWYSVEPGAPVPYRGPTWSWVAPESRFIFYRHDALRNEDFHAEVLDVGVTVTGLNPYGRVSSGKITMLGRVAPMPSHGYGNDDESETYLSKHMYPLVYWDLPGPPQLGCLCFLLQDIYCLILAPEARSYRGVYRRVGAFSARDDPKGILMEVFKNLDWRIELVTII
jgi:hypothetical protein